MLRYLIKNILLIRERIYLDTRERYNIELDNNYNSLIIR